MATRRLAALAGVLLVLAGLLQSSSPTGRAHSFASPIQENRIVPGDVIEVQVEGAPELSRTYTVNASGAFLMRFLGSITAQHKTEIELADTIADGLRGRYLKNPRVSVMVIRPSGAVRNLLGATNQYYFIQGAVRNPGVYRMEGRASLSRLIDLAGGLTNTHGQRAYIIRSNRGTRTDGRDNAEPEYETTTVNIDRPYNGAISEDVPLQQGDVVNIPVADIVFVRGEVNAPGSFPFKQGMTLREVMVLTRGLTVNAAASRGVIFREDPATGKRTEIRVDIGAITSGKSKDVVLQPYDIIIVPSSRMKTINPLRFFDSPPIPRRVPCKGSRPCMAVLNREKTTIEAVACVHA